MFQRPGLNDDPESRFKEPLFRVFLAAIGVVIVAGLMPSLLQGDLRQVPMAVPTVALFLGVWFALRRWGYQRVITPFVYALVSLFLTSVALQGYQNEQSFLLVAAILVVMSLVATLFLNRSGPMVILIVLLWVYYAAFVAAAFLSHRVTVRSLTLSEQLVGPVLLLVISTVFVLLIRTIFRRILGEYRQVSDDHLRGQESLGQLVRGLSHHLNTPLGNAKLLLSVTRSDTNAACFDPDAPALLEGAIDTSIGLVRRLADFMRHCDHPPRATTDGAGLRSLVTGRRERPPVWRASVALDRALARPREHSWETIVMVLDELIENAWLHGGGQPTVSADIVRGQLIFLVEDTGPGIDAEILNRVRDPFLSRLVSGDHPGLGLYFADYLTTFVLGGTLLISSTPGGGTRVTFAVPL